MVGIIYKGDYMNNCTLFVNSCDAYESVWFPFFELIKTYWKDCPYDVALCTETKKYVHDGLNIKILNSKYADNYSWSEKLYDNLSAINTKYVFLMLEDFFLQDDVDQNELNKCQKWMDENPNIACFYFKKLKGSYKECEYDNYFEVTKDLIYRLSIQGLWNREILMSFIDFSENPWDFEIKGSNRIKKSSNKLFYCHKYSLPHPFDYENSPLKPVPFILGESNGYGITRGKWLWNNHIIFDKLNIKVDYNALGIQSCPSEEWLKKKGHLIKK